MGAWELYAMPWDAMHARMQMQGPMCNFRKLQGPMCNFRKLQGLVAMQGWKCECMQHVSLYAMQENMPDDVQCNGKD